MAALTTDLQLSANAFRDLAAKGLVPVVPTTRPTVSAVSSSQPATKLVWAKGRLAALAVVALLVVGGCLGVTVNSDNTASDFEETAHMGARQSGPVVDEPFLTDFIASYQARFHTTEVLLVESNDDGLLVVVPAAGRTGRSTAYTYDGGFHPGSRERCSRRSSGRSGRPGRRTRRCPSRSRRR